MPAPQTQSLLIGASGQIGSALSRLVGPARCLATARRPAGVTELQLDLSELTDLAQAETLLAGRPLDAIYCIGGMTHVDGCEDQPALAFATNTTGPAVLAALAQRRGLPFVYFSTEYVFDGIAGPYAEEAPTNPICVYGRSKLEGEQAVLAACADAIIIRTTVVYGEDAGAKNFVYSLLRTLGAGRPMRVPMDQISTPTYNRDLAQAAVELVHRQATGVFHVCGPERVDRLHFARDVAHAFDLDVSLLEGLPTSELAQRAPRPLSAGLISHRLPFALAGLHMQTLAQGLADCRPVLEAYLAHTQQRPS